MILDGHFTHLIVKRLKIAHRSYRHARVFNMSSDAYPELTGFLNTIQTIFLIRVFKNVIKRLCSGNDLIDDRANVY
jgi:hypothetical protein